MENTFLSSLSLEVSTQSCLDAAINIFKSSITLNSADCDAYIKLGLSLYEQCFFEASIQTFTQALKPFS